MKIWVRLLVVFVLVILSGIAPLRKEYTQALKHAQEAKSNLNYLQAGHFLGEAAELIPWRLDLWESAGRYALHAGDSQQAIQYLDHVANSGQLTLDGNLALAEAYWQIGDLDMALDYWQEALGNGGSPNQLYPLILNAHLCARDYPGAIRVLVKLADLEPTEAKWEYQLGLLLASQEPSLAITHLEHSVELEPGLAQSANKLAGVIEVKILSDQPAYVLTEAGRALASIDEWELAAEAFKQATIHRPDYADAWAFYGEALQHFDQPTANTQLDARFALIPANCLGIQPWHQDLTKESRLAVEHAYELNPNSLVANTFLALFYKRQDQFELATESLTRAMNLDPDNPIIQVELGNIQAQQGDLEAAIKHFQLATRVSNGNPTYSKLLLQFIVQYRYQLETTGLPIARQLVSNYPRDAESMVLLGQVQLLLEDHLSAEISFKAAIQMNPQYTPAYLHLGELYYAQGKLVPAQNLLAKAYALSPTSVAGEQAQYLLQLYFP